MDNRWACLVLALAGLALVRSAEQCHVSSDHCSCTTSDNKLTINLNHIGLSYPAKATDSEDKYEFSYMPCKPVVCEGSTGDPSVVCQDILSQKTSVSLGRATNMNWTIINSNSSSLKFEIMYKDGDGKRETKVTFTRNTDTTTTFKYEREDDKTLLYYFEVNGKGVAPYGGGGSGSGSGGTIAGPIGLVIIFLALGALIAYFVIGGIYMYVQKGARGLEVIPNYSFWKDLPFLIKDGFLFMISPCYKRGEKYQSL